MALAALELVQPSRDGGFWDLLVCYAVVAYDAVAVGGHLDDTVHFIGVIAPIKCDVLWTQASLDGSDDYRVAPVAQHGPHAGACRRADPYAVSLEDFLDAVFGISHLFRLYVVVGCGRRGGFGAAGVTCLAAVPRVCGRVGAIGRYVVVGCALVLGVTVGGGCIVRIRLVCAGLGARILFCGVLGFCRCGIGLLVCLAALRFCNRVLVALFLRV